MRRRAGQWIQVLGAGLMLAGLAGCAMFNEASWAQSRTTTIGAELIDLQTAREKGAVTEEEYEKLKQSIMQGGPIVGGGKHGPGHCARGR